ncbi:MAG: hypothetical protein A2Y62_06825 [Candidatus Fischerbacteria bacterium RBG_13_37_8]|uniref:Peptidase M16 C-terminal domain-containing protein n=1 Tax=Candidatus Fischerbacteria bacterium RBG_13_37_8 TaxID=1817863 RepID=A0A1F5VMN9_9BACT|nr:MAG: hypothetical protein A2Y62_06825 [Candidatus Fischerbacteria bacterium RBG_13_37_8]
MSRKKTVNKILPATKRIRFANGLTLILVEWHSLPMVHIKIMFKTGTIDVPPEKAGLAEAAVYLPSQGTDSKNAMEIAREIDFIGAKFNSKSREDASHISLTILKKHLHKGLALLNDVLLHPQFLTEELERWKKRTLSSLAQEKADPSITVSKKFKKFIFQSCPYGNYPIETTVHAISRTNVSDFYHSYYTPNNATIVIVGDVIPDEIVDEVNTLFSKWKPSELPPESVVEVSPPDHFTTQLINKDDLNQAQIRYGYITTNRNTPEFFPILLLNYILGGGGFSSRLMAEIRSNKGYTYGISSAFLLYKYSGIFVISTFTKNEIVFSMINEIRNQLHILKNNNVTEEELFAAKSYFKGSFAQKFERPETISDQLLYVELYQLPEDYFDTFKSNIEKVTIQDIKNAIEHFIHPDRAGIVILGKSNTYMNDMNTLGTVELKNYNDL